MPKGYYCIKENGDICFTLQSRIEVPVACEGHTLQTIEDVLAAEQEGSDLSFLRNPVLYRFDEDLQCPLLKEEAINNGI